MVTVLVIVAVIQTSTYTKETRDYAKDIAVQLRTLQGESAEARTRQDAMMVALIQALQDLVSRQGGDPPPTPR